jgi:hypothetical protein
MRTEKRRIAGLEVGVRFPEFGVDHNRYAGQVVTVVVPGHEDRPLRYVVGRSRLPEGVGTDTAEGQDAALLFLMPQIETDVSEVIAGKEVAAQKVPVY